MATREAIIDALKLAQLSGFTFSVNYAAPSGADTVYISPEDLADIVLSKRTIHSLVTGLTSEEYAEWLALDGALPCSATTKAGRQCRCLVTGSRFTDPAQWLEERAKQGYCRIHGGE